MSSNPLPKQSTNHHCPFISTKSNPTQVLCNEYADALAKKSITTYSDVADASIKTAGTEGNPFPSIYWIAREYEEHRIIQIQQNTAHGGLAIHHLKALVPPQTRECQYRSELP
jgi:hypothetical protein